MREAFYNYLLRLGYKDSTPSGAPSTISQYVKSIDNVVKWEKIGNWDQLISRLPIILKEYDIGGSKAHLGEKSNRTVINALYRFAEFFVSQM